jgi:dipeptidyl aminopeptidase/acylaminoacyl peptidase
LLEAMPMTGKRRAQLADLARVAVPAQPAISPDGATIAYALRTVDSAADENRSSLWQVPATGGAPVQLTHGSADSAPAWSPDGQQLAFLRRGPDGPPQLWLLPAGPGEPRPLTGLPGGAGAAAWSPDGTAIAFTAPVDPAGERPEHAPVVADRLGYKLDGVGLWRGRHRQVFIVDLASAETRQVTSGDWHAGNPAWSPDGRWLAYPAATAPDADLTGESEAYVLEVATGEHRQVGPAGGMAGPLTWTPAGDALVVVGRQQVRPGHALLLRVPVAGGEVTELAAGFDRNIMPGGPGYPGGLPQYAAHGRTLLFCARDRGCTHLYSLEQDGPEPHRLVGGAGRVVSALSVAAAGTAAALVVATPESFGEVAVVDHASGELTVLTDHSLPDVALFEPQERVFRISDGTEVHGWLLRDPAARTPAPLLLDIHGGPHNAWSPVPAAGRFYRQLLAARGWAVLLLNPRGSDGYGEQFYTAAVGSWGAADERDFLEPLDALVAEGVADPERLAVTGYSYGGYMTCWLTGRTGRFKAAVPGGPVADLASMAGTSDAGNWLVRQEIGAQPYEDPQRVAAQSPYQLVGEVRTPTLVLQGAADDRCPAGQAEQWFAALRARGVPARLVLYPGSSHLFLYDGRPSHREDYCRRVVDWVTRYTRSAPRLDGDHWQRRLAELIDRFGVPGAVLGVDRDGERVMVAAGVTNVDTGVPVTPETLFQIGSVTKTLTATAVLRLVDDGRLDLDKPVVTYLPELTLADPAVTQQLTLRHLLTHTSGIDGDIFTDTGRGDDCLARYVAGLAEAPLVQPLGAGFSYSNAGYAIVGRGIEVVTGKVWDEAMRELLFGPLGMDHVATLPEQALLHRTAVGHVHQPGEPPRRTAVWSLPRALASFGGTPCTTAGDLLTFARMHLAGGVAPDGARVLSAESVAAMQSEQVRLPGADPIGDSWGLGWSRLTWGGSRLVGHNGGTLGQSSYLRLMPDHDLAITLLTNAGDTRDLYEAVVPELVAELTGISVPAPVGPDPDLSTVDAAPYAGTYRRTGARYEVTARQLRIIAEHQVPGLDDLAPRELELRPVDANGSFAVKMPGTATWQQVVFGELPDGTAYLHFGLRVAPKLT